MARKFKTPGSSLKAFSGPRSAPPKSVETDPEPDADEAPFQRSWLASRTEMMNLVLFTFFGCMGYVQYFFNHAPAYPSLILGLGFSVILPLYLYILRLRRRT